MLGIASWQAEIKLDINDLKKRLSEAEKELGEVTEKEHKLKLDIDTKILDSAIKKLDKMLDSLGKGTGDFKQLENLSKELSEITFEVKDFNKAFGKLDDSGAKTLLSSIQNIDRSLSELSQHILNVNKNISNMGGNTNGAVKQVENIGNAAADAVKQVDKLADAQSKFGNKISTPNAAADLFGLKQQEKQIKKNTDSLKKLSDLLYNIKDVNKSDYSKNNNWVGYYKTREEAVESDLSDKKDRLNSTLNLILSEDKNAINELKSEIDNLESSLESVQELSNHISSNSKLDKNKDYASQYKLIDDRLGELNNKYELTNSELEEYITLQIKAEKITDKMMAESGGVKGSGAKNKSELKLWTKRDLARELGYNSDDIYSGLFGNITDALYDGKISLFNADGTKKNIREISAELLNYKSVISDFTGSFGANEDFGRLSELKGIFDYIKQNLKEIQSTDFSSQIESEKGLIGTLKLLGTDDEYIKKEEENLQKLIFLQDKLESSKKNNPDDNYNEKIVNNLKEQETQALATVEAEKKLTEAQKESTSTSSETNISSGMKDAFPDVSTDTKSEIDGMEQVEKATEKAVQAKKNFTAANEDVQSSIDGSKNPLKLEAELMEQISKSASEAADSKKEFVEANKVLKANSDLYDNELQRSKLQQIKTDTNKRIAEPQNKNEEQARNKAFKYIESAQKKLKDAIYKYDYGDTSEASAELEKLGKAWANFATKDNPNPTLEQVEARMKEIDKTIASIISKLKTDHTSNLKKLNDEIKDEDKSKKKKTSDENATKWSTFNNDLNKTKKSEERKLQGKSINKQAKSIEQLEKELEDFHTQGIISEKQFTDAINKINGIKQHLQDMKDDINKNFTDNLDKSVEKYQKELGKRQNKPENQNQGKPYKDALNEFSSKLKELEAIQIKIRNNNGLATEEDKTRVEELTKEIEKYSDALKNMSAANKGSTEISRQKELQKIGDYLQRNTKISEEAKAKLKAYMTELKSGSASTNIEHIHTEFLKIAQAEREAGREGKSFFSVIKEKVFYGAAGSIASYFGINDLIQYGKQAAGVVINLNSQIVDLAKVSEDSISQIYDDFDSYANIAKDIGGTISDTIEATAAWAKNGYNIPDSKELARVSQLYQNVGDNIDIQSADESLISTLKGFRLKTDQAEHIVDVFNEVSNNEAISSSGIGAALQRSAASFNAANTTLEQATALVTATNTVLQDEEKTGNMWKTVSARLRGADAELKEMGEDTDGMVTSTSKLRDLVKGMTGFDIMKDEKTFKSIYDIIIGIGEQWNNLSDVNRASLLEKLAGKQQSNALAAALSNIDVLKKSYNEAMNADGSAMQEQQKYQKSIQYSIDQTKAKLEELSNDVLSSDFLKGAIDSAGKFVDILDSIVKSGNAIPAIATAIAAAFSFKNVGRDKMYSLSFEYADNIHNLLWIQRFKVCYP